MKCPDKEQLMLFVDRELDSNESAQIEAHLHECKDCMHEVENFKLDLETEALLRNKINHAFQNRSVNKKIMTAVMSEPKPKTVESSKGSSFWSSWLLKLMVPALAIAIALFIVLGGIQPNKSTSSFNGRSYRISVLANNNQSDCYVNDQIYTATNSFDVNAESFKKLDGNFLVNVVTPSEFYSFNVEGKTNLGFELTSMRPVFDDCKAKITIVNGNSASIKVNGEKFNISKLQPYIFKQETDIKLKDEFKEPENKPVKPIEKVKVEEKQIATITDQIIVKESNQNKNEDNDSTEIETDTEITGFGAEQLTQEQIDDISVIELDLNNEDGKHVSPFSN